VSFSGATEEDGGCSCSGEEAIGVPVQGRGGGGG
jgi:hypothetical protein